MKLQTQVSVLLAALVFLAACAPLDSVREYSAGSLATTEQVWPVAMDFVDSCERGNEYRITAHRQDCSEEAQASRAVAIVAEALSLYVQALGDLASDELVYYDEELDGFSAELNDLKFVQKLENSDAKVEAVSGLAKVIAKAATDRYRQSKIKEVIIAANQPLQQVTETLAGIIDSNYIFALQLESDARHKNLRTLEHQYSRSEPLAWEMYLDWHDKREQLLADKKAAALELAQTIRSIGVTHEELYQRVNDLRARDLAETVRRYVKEIKPVLNQVHKAFD